MMSKFDLFKSIFAVWIVLAIIESSLAALLQTEKPEICELDQFTCSSDGRCIPMKWKCDGDPDCKDESDEKNCQKRKCPLPKSPVYGKKEGRCCYVDDIVKFSCDDGYELTGESEIKCLEDGSWNAAIPECSEICNDEQFKCRNGTCISRSWVCDNDVDCADESDEEDCGTGCTFPSRPENLLLDFEKHEHRNSLTVAPERYILKFQCKKGYQIAGPKSIICFNGEWNEKFPYCMRLYCEEPPAIENGSYEVIKGNNPSPIIGSRTLYSCSKGFELKNVNVSELNCRLNDTIAVWDGEIPSCREKDVCPDPGSPPDGERTGSCCLKGNVVKFSCNEGFKMIGKGKIECLPGGVWSAPRARCKPQGIVCPDPPEIRNAIIHRSGDFETPGKMVIVFCDDGYSIQGGSDQLECQEDGQWDAEFGTCEVAHCEAPKIPEHGYIVQLEHTNATIFPHRFHLRYTCDDAYKISGTSWNTCEGGAWKFNTPNCELITCYDPGTPTNGNRGISRSLVNTAPGKNTKTPKSLAVNTRVTYSCFDEHTLLGTYERFCMSNGQWSGETARCNLASNYCPDPGVPINGKKTGEIYEDGSVVKFSCYPGFFLLGSETRICQHNHEWSGEEARCRGPNEFDNNVEVLDRLNNFVGDKVQDQKEELKKYEQSLRKALPEMPANATLEELEEAANRARSPLSLHLLKRTVLYFLFDSSGSIGEENFNTSIQFAKALVKQVGGVSEGGMRVGALSFSSDANVNFLPVDHNETKSVLEALDQIPYQTGGTHISVAFETVKLVMIRLTNVLLKNVTKSVIFILTDGKANMGGDPHVLTKDLKKDGVEIYCVGITGDDNIEALYKIASEDDNVFVLHDYGTMSWLIQKITYGTIDYSECGLSAKRRPSKQHEGNEMQNRARIYGGTLATQSWPWMAALFYVIDPRTKGRELGCGGSIIAKEWILTAAHCLTDKTANNTKRSLESVIIKLGLVDLKNETNAQRFKPKEFVIHEQYNAFTIDYDIALIKVDRVIEFSEYIRPICLPPAELPGDTNLYKPGSKVTVIGWGDDTKREPRVKDFRIVPQLKQATLPIRTNETCLNSLKKYQSYVYTDRMLCAGDGVGEIDTCHGDSGGPMMQQQFSKEKNDYWVQVGIVSWGIGCAQMHTYGFYTKVHLLRDWIEQQMSLY